MSTARVYPLKWPKGWPRTEANRRENGTRFKECTLASALSGLKREVTLLGGKNLVLSSNYTLGNEHPKDIGVVAYFLRGETSVAIPCDRWNRVEYNVRAIALTIEAMRGMERWGAKNMIEAMFQGFVALPEKTQASCWEVLGIDNINKGTDRERAENTILDAYRRKARETHPDNGGSTEAFSAVVAAKDIALQLIRQ